jgi:transposase
MKRREYSEEFRLEAIKLARQGDLPVAQVARELGIHDSVLYRWIRKSDGKSSSTVADGLSGDERAEFARLRREVRRLETEREILKRAVGIFSEELR